MKLAPSTFTHHVKTCKEPKNLHLSTFIIIVVIVTIIKFL